MRMSAKRPEFRRYAVALVCLLPLAGAAMAARAPDLQKGVNAFDKGSYAAALRELEPLAGHGDAKAQYYVGLMFENGWGVKRSYETAVDWMRKAADAGEARAQFSMGYFYANGLGVLRDYAQAARYYRLAADAGSAGAQVDLGLLYSRCDGVRKGEAESVRLYRRGRTNRATCRAISIIGHTQPPPRTPPMTRHTGPR